MSTRAAVAVLHNADAYMVGYADEGTRGYTPTSYLYDTYDEAREAARILNREAFGLTDERANEIILSTMSI